MIYHTTQVFIQIPVMTSKLGLRYQMSSKCRTILHNNITFQLKGEQKELPPPKKHTDLARMSCWFYLTLRMTFKALKRIDDWHKCVTWRKQLLIHIQSSKWLHDRYAELLRKHCFYYSLIMGGQWVDKKLHHNDKHADFHIVKIQIGYVNTVLHYNFIINKRVPITSFKAFRAGVQNGSACSWNLVVVNMFLNQETRYTNLLAEARVFKSTIRRCNDITVLPCIAEHFVLRATWRSN